MLLRRSIDRHNQYRRWIDPRHRSLRLADVIAYLVQHGWKQLPSDRKAFLAFQEPTGEVVNGKAVCQFIPDSEDYDHYGTLMFELLTGLAEFENRQASEVIDDILHLAGRNSTAGVGHKQVRRAEASSE